MISRMMDQTSFSQLIAALHGGTFEQSQWNQFLRALRVATGADFANLVFRRRDAPMNVMTPLMDGNGPIDELSHRYMHSLYQIDPLPYYRLEPGRVYTLPELLDPSVEGTHAFIEEFLNPAGIHHLRIVRMTEPSGFQAWMTVTRASSDFSPAVSTLLEIAAEHLKIVLQNLSALETARQQSAIYKAAIEQLNVGFLTIDRAGRVVNQDSHASQFLARSDPLSLDPQGRILVHPAGARRAFRSALRSMGERSDGRVRAIHLSENPRMDMLVVPYGEPAISGDSTPVATIYIHGEKAAPKNRADQLCEMFALTRTEAGLALSLSCGLSLKDAALDLGISIETARTYSKRIFQKTGTHRQAELVSLILRSVVSFS